MLKFGYMALGQVERSVLGQVGLLSSHLFEYLYYRYPPLRVLEIGSAPAALHAKLVRGGFGVTRD